MTAVQSGLYFQHSEHVGGTGDGRAVRLKIQLDTLPMAVVSWKHAGPRRRVMQVVKSERLYRTSEEAGAVALEKAKAWIERRSSQDPLP